MTLKILDLYKKGIEDELGRNMLVWFIDDKGLQSDLHSV